MQSLFQRQRNAISYITDEKGDKRINVDSSKLNIFEHTDIILPDWKPREIPPLESRSYLCLDIETSGLGNSNDRDYINANFDPKGCVIKMIGLKDHRGKYKILAGNNEEAILREFVKILMLKQPYFLFTFNGNNFDLPFIFSRLNYYGIHNPFWIAEKPSTMSAAQKFGNPSIFHQFYLSWGNGKKTYHIDLYLQALAYDFVARKLTEFSLKKIPVALGLRGESDRVELTFQEMLECYETGNWDLMSEYLRHDLDDTDRLQAFFVPSIYYQQLVIPKFNPQQLHVYGNATKLNMFLNCHYGETNKPEIDPKVRFQGGKTRAYCGFFKNVVKMDVASLYPTIMLAYGIGSEKDKENILLAALSYLKKTRLWHKANAKDKSKPEDERRLSKQIEGSYKVIINSCFAGETEVLTSKGIFPIRDLSGSSHEVLNLNGQWSNSEFKSYGIQQIWEVKLKKGLKEKIIRTTANHKWLAAPDFTKNNKVFEFKTSELKSNYGIPSSSYYNLESSHFWQVVSVKETEEFEEVFCCVEPETHYFTLADNVITGNCYGFLGAIGDYNDYEAAALVTAYGREILDHMIKISLEMGAVICGVDTDAVAISCPEGREDEICKVLKESVPEWVELEREWDADVYVPATISLDSFEKSYKLRSKNGVKFMCKIFQETKMIIDDEEIEIPAISEAEQALMLTKFGDRQVSLELFYEMSEILGRDFVVSDGLRKNYIVFLKDGSIKTMGKYRKRDKSKLFKQWPVDYLKNYREHGKEKADEFYLETHRLISSGNYPLEDLCITKKIPVSDKKFTRQGLGDHGDVITYYATSDDSEALLGSGEPYSVSVYLHDLETYYKEIQDTLTIQKMLNGDKTVRRQLALI